MNTAAPPLTLTYDQAVEHLLAIVAEKGEDFAYTPVPREDGEDCRYFDADGQPSCGIGHVLARIGILPFEVDSPINTDPVRRLATTKVLTIDQRTRDLLTAFQAWQDLGEPWGEALRYALQFAGGERQ